MFLDLEATEGGDSMLSFPWVGHMRKRWLTPTRLMALRKPIRSWPQR